jgi:hypothetical protein
MKNITNLYIQLNEGKISKEFFMKTARMQFPQYISPTLSFRDTVNVLKGKRLIQEAQTLTVDQVIDRLNPYQFRNGVQKELAKVQNPTREDIHRANQKVAKKLQKNPTAYEDQMFANAKDIEKRDDKLHTSEVKVGSQSVDKGNAMKVKKKLESANTRATKKENKKGKPRGVKVMTYKAKTAKGISETMPATGKEKVLKVLHENMYGATVPTPHDWHVGREVNTPKGIGTIKEVHGGTLTVEMKDGKMVEYQMNVVEKHTNSAKQGSNMQQKSSSEMDNKADKLKEIAKTLKNHIKKMREGEMMRSKKPNAAGKRNVIVVDDPKAKAAAIQANYEPAGKAEAPPTNQ